MSVAPVPGAPPYVAVPYLERMDLALAAADLALCRAGALTVAELSAVGLPAVYVPLPHGNGEQGLNSAHLVATGAALRIDDAALDGDVLVDKLVPLLDPEARAAMRAALQDSGAGSVAEDLAARIAAAAGKDK